MAGEGNVSLRPLFPASLREGRRAFTATQKKRNKKQRDQHQACKRAPTLRSSFIVAHPNVSIHCHRSNHSSAVSPFRLSLFNESVNAFSGIVSFHQLVEIQALHFLKCRT